MKIHEQIREARVAQSRKVTEIARIAEVDDAHLIRFERGERGMSSEKVDRVLAALGLELRVADEHSPSEVAFEDAPTVT